MYFKMVPFLLPLTEGQGDFYMMFIVNSSASRVKSHNTMEASYDWVLWKLLFSSLSVLITFSIRSILRIFGKTSKKQGLKTVSITLQTCKHLFVQSLLCNQEYKPITQICPRTSFLNVSEFPSFVRLNDILLYVQAPFGLSSHLPVGTWVASTCGLLSIMLL